MFHLGIDWGTQSSKIYTFNSSSGEETIIGHMPESALYYDNQFDVIGFSETFKNKKISEMAQVNLSKGYAIKRKMIMNPDAPFWNGNWDDTNLTLGASVTLSLLGLLREAIKEIGENNRDKISEICFSFPNWAPEIDVNHSLALRKFRQAARLASIIALNNNFDSYIPQEGIKNNDFVALINTLNPNWEPPKLDFNNVSNLRDNEGSGVSRSYIPESIAGGLPYLLKLQSQENHAFRLLVIDVGAGSTDICYLAQWRTEKNKPFHIVYHKPAPAIGIAGEAVTEAVAKQFTLLRDEAEIKKIELSNLEKLHIDVPYVRDEWIRKIADSARDYIQQIPKHILMDRPEPVRVIITGGSGAVPGLMDEVIKSVQEGLKNNPNRPKSPPPKSLVAEPIRAQIYSTINVYETGRRVVSIGAGQPSKSKLVFA